MTGLEPAASNVTGWRSNQLSYTPNLLNAKDLRRSDFASIVLWFLLWFLERRYERDPGTSRNRHQLEQPETSCESRSRTGEVIASPTT